MREWSYSPEVRATREQNSVFNYRLQQAGAAEEEKQEQAPIKQRCTTQINSVFLPTLAFGIPCCRNENLHDGSEERQVERTDWESPQRWFMLLMPFSKDGKLHAAFTAVPDSCPADGLLGRCSSCSPRCLRNAEARVGNASKPAMAMRAGRRYEWKPPCSWSHQPTVYRHQSPPCPQKSHHRLLMHLRWMLKYQLAVWSKFCWFSSRDTFSPSIGNFLVSPSQDARV